MKHAYYNEIDPFCAAWLRNLIAAGHIAPGDVDERSIVDVRPAELAGYAQCHFFAGIGGWSVALRLAGWPDDRPVWTGSCPCQPFSAAGKGEAADDERHLWPAWLPLIAERRPAIVFGEQVEAAIGWGWIDAVFANLEGEGYACGASVLPACGVGAPHIRQRVWFVADSGSGRHEQVAGGIPELSRQETAIRLDGFQLERSGAVGELGNTEGRDGRIPARSIRQEDYEFARASQAHELGDSSSPRLQERERDGRLQREALEPPEGQATVGGGSAGGMVDAAGPRRDAPERSRQRDGGSPPQAAQLTQPSPWRDLDWLPCTDGKARPVEPGTFPLAHGIPGRVGRLRAYGNAITPQVAAEFIIAATGGA